ncbi:MAG TPA: hypothetical protein VNI01_03730 [Elusimicrobiota bacterium]|jgi:Tfp pilus assembly protein PilV|nr:hypothetical protein [Elusimicrobiota bacterium]
MKGKAPGFALAEVMIAILLAAAVTAGVFAATLSSRLALEKSDDKARADAIVHQITGILGNYQGPDPTDAAHPVDTSYAPNGCWDIPDSMGGCSGGWALTAGTHDVGQLLPAGLAAAGWTANYTVTDNGSTKAISVNVSWPQQATGP